MEVDAVGSAPGPSRSNRRGSAVVRRICAAAILWIAPWLAWSPPAVADVSGPCAGTINGVDVNQADSPRSAIEVDVKSSVVVSGTDATSTAFSTVQLRFAPFSWTVADERYDGSRTDWRNTVKIKDYAKYGVGLYQVVARTDDCAGSAWVKVTGRSPFTTAAGIAGAALGVAGGAGIVAVALPSRRSGSPTRRGIAAGVPAGAGLALLAQQAALTPLTAVTAAAWVALGASAGALAAFALRARSGHASPAPPSAVSRPA